MLTFTLLASLTVPAYVMRKRQRQLLRQMHRRVDVLNERAEADARKRPRVQQPTDEHIMQVRRNAQGDTLPVDTNVYTIAPAPVFTKDTDYQHGTLPRVPKHQLHFTRY